MIILNILFIIVLSNKIKAKESTNNTQSIFRLHTETFEKNTTTNEHKYFPNGLFNIKNRTETKRTSQLNNFFALDNLLKFTIDNSIGRSMPESKNDLKKFLDNEFIANQPIWTVAVSIVSFIIVVFIVGCIMGMCISRSSLKKPKVRMEDAKSKDIVDLSKTPETPVVNYEKTVQKQIEMFY